MTENAGIDPRVAAAEDAAYGDQAEELDATQRAEDPTQPKPDPDETVS